MSFNGWCIKRDMYTRTLSPARDIAAGQHNQRETCCGAAIATCALAFEFPECSDVWSGWRKFLEPIAATFYKKQISRRCSRFRLRAHTPTRKCGALGTRGSRPHSGSTTDPSASLGISPAGSHPNTQVRRVGDPEAPASLTPAKRLNNRSLGFARDFACGLSPQHASAARWGPRCSRFAHARKAAQLNKTFCLLFTQKACLFEMIIHTYLS